jgi:hypothetical protein
MRKIILFVLIVPFALFVIVSIFSPSSTKNTSPSVNTSLSSNSAKTETYTTSQSNYANTQLPESNSTNSYDPNASTTSDETKSATVEYYNPQTGYSATYTLDVDVEDGQVTKIHFPNGGYLDEDHIAPADIEDGKAHVEGEEGKTYDVEIDE